MRWEGLLFVVAGLFSCLGGAMGWEWFMNHRKARFMVTILGRNGARGFYVLLGAGLAVLGGLIATGAISSRT